MSSVAIAAIFAAMAAAGAYSDVRRQKIPNALSAIMAAAGIVAVWWLGGFAEAISAVGHFVTALLIGVVIYAVKMWGAGDAKFYAASAAWFPIDEAPRLILTISLAGLALVLGWLAARKLLRDVGKWHMQRELPYGVAIALGGVITIMADATQFRF